MASEKKIKISLFRHFSVNYETVMTAKLRRHLVLVVMAAEAKHLHFGFSGYPVVMMVSASFS